MAYDKDEIFNQAITTVEQNESIIFVSDLVAYVDCNTSTFYKLFPADSEEMEIIKEKLSINKIKIKAAIREKLKKSNKAAELLALYRLVSTPDEHRLLNQSYIDHTSKNEKIKTISDLFPTEEELRAKHDNTDAE